MIDFELYDDVITEFSQDFTFTRFTTAIVVGREVKTAIIPSKVIFCYIHPATDKDFREVEREGYHIENMVKIFASVDADIIQDDEVVYRNETYRVMKQNIKVVGDYSKFFAELINDWLQTDNRAIYKR